MKIKLAMKSLCIGFLGGLALSVEASSLSITVVNDKQQPVDDVVIELLPQKLAEEPSSEASQKNDESHEIGQRNRTFVPFVSAVTVGSSVAFPNYDKTRHHVYSFSKAKTFELKLYVGSPDTTIQFNKAGVVAIGCNIHDYMQAYIYVGGSPWMGVTKDDGRVQVQQLPKGTYQLKLWHPWQLEAFEQKEIVLSENSKSIKLTFNIEEKEKPSPPENKWQDLFKDTP
ncbi:methylamine utilization protein [Kangiella marina]|uniref:Methylamine utilization protein n=1 Tax=Kangiella marina TaxID=1079178 RepID=A0ABP8IE11_9GAMM